MTAAIRPVIRAAVGSDRATAIDVLTTAFCDDPLSVWVVPDPDRRRRFHDGIFGAAFDDALDGGAALVAEVEGAIAGVALWYPPGREPDPAGTNLDAARAVLAAPDLQRLMHIRELMGQSHPNEAHYYLWLAGVTPRHHNRGVGGALMADALERCDRQGHGAYLEATSPSNRRLYRRWGFRDRDPIALPGRLGIFPMWRDPHQAG